MAQCTQVSGQVYYHLSRARQGRRIRDVVLVRLEQIAPFPHDLVGKVSQNAGFDDVLQTTNPETEHLQRPLTFEKPRDISRPSVTCDCCRSCL